MIYLYRLSYSFFKLVLQMMYFILSPKTKKWIQLRSSVEYLNTSVSSPLWFHASSGEIEYCKSIIKEIKQLDPDQKIVISYSSPSAEKLLFNIKDEVDSVFPLPWDTKKSISKAFNHFKPKAIIFSRTDFWPELIYQAEQQNISLMAVSMFPRLNSISRLIFSWLLKNFSFITTVNSMSSKTLSDLLGKNVDTFSDTRFDQVFNRLNSPPKVTFSDNVSTDKRIVFASTWPEDEAVIFPCLNPLVAAGYQIILAPHDTYRAQDLAEKLKKYNPELLSSHKNLTEIQMQTSILIVDRVGYLADIYRYSSWTFVGGSFKQKIHSVMEPLAAGNCVLFGPHFSNNPEALETQQKGLTYLVKSSDDILKLIRPENVEMIRQNLNQVKEYTEKQRGSSRLIAKKILNLTTL